MHNWSLILLALLAVFQPNAFAESNIVDGRQQCNDYRDTRLSLYGSICSNKPSVEARRVEQRQNRAIENRRHEIRDKYRYSPLSERQNVDDSRREQTRLLTRVSESQIDSNRNRDPSFRNRLSNGERRYSVRLTNRDVSRAQDVEFASRNVETRRSRDFTTRSQSRSLHRLSRFSHNSNDRRQSREQREDYPDYVSPARASIRRVRSEVTRQASPQVTTDLPHASRVYEQNSQRDREFRFRTRESFSDVTSRSVRNNISSLKGIQTLSEERRVKSARMLDRRSNTLSRFNQLEERRDTTRSNRLSARENTERELARDIRLSRETGRSFVRSERRQPNRDNVGQRVRRDYSNSRERSENRAMHFRQLRTLDSNRMETRNQRATNRFTRSFRQENRNRAALERDIRSAERRIAHQATRNNNYMPKEREQTRGLFSVRNLRDFEVDTTKPLLRSIRISWTPEHQKETQTPEPYITNWQYILYSLNAIYLISVLMKMAGEKKQGYETFWTFGRTLKIE